MLISSVKPRVKAAPLPTKPPALRMAHQAFQSSIPPALLYPGRGLLLVSCCQLAPTSTSQAAGIPGARDARLGTGPPLRPCGSRAPSQLMRPVFCPQLSFLYASRAAVPKPRLRVGSGVLPALPQPPSRAPSRTRAPLGPELPPARPLSRGAPSTQHASRRSQSSRRPSRRQPTENRRIVRAPITRSVWLRKRVSTFYFFLK